MKNNLNTLLLTIYLICLLITLVLNMQLVNLMPCMIKFKHLEIVTSGLQVYLIPIHACTNLGITDRLRPLSDLPDYNTPGFYKTTVTDMILDTHFHVFDSRYATPILGLFSCMALRFVRFVSSFIVKIRVKQSLPQVVY